MLWKKEHLLHNIFKIGVKRRYYGRIAFAHFLQFAIDDIFLQFAIDDIFCAHFVISIAHYFHTPNQGQLVVIGRETMTCTGNHTDYHTDETRI